MIQFEQWEGFEGRIWKEEVNVRDFIQKNYTPYDGDESFLAGPTEATDKLWGALQQLQKAERAKGGVLDMETEVVSSLTSYGPGYIDESLKDLEQIVGLQTDKPLKRAFMPYGGIKMAEQACTTYGYQPSAELHKIFTDYTRTHNQAVFDAYTPEMKKARHTHIITGLPDTYGRGRIVGDYRRVALYGIDALIQFKQEDLANCGDGTMTDDVIRLREEIARQISALKGMKKMAEAYGYDISQPAKDAKEACQWLYFGYLAAIKTQNGAAMSVGRISTFLDIYIQRDLDKDMESQVERHISENQLRRRKKEVYINRLQKELLDAYKQPLKNMTISQGKLLIRLVDREIGKAPYSVIKEYKNGLSAGFWQGVAKIFGQDLTTHYDPKGEDKMTEYLVEKWQRGEFDALYYSIFWEMPKHPDIVSKEIKFDE